MTPAEKRIKELIDRWLTSIELHLQYTSLSDEAYWKVQAWPKHDRPTRWVLESAKQKANELKEIFESRHAMGDSKFADAMELMSFLANLVGAQHLERFVPLAEPKADVEMPVQPTRPAPVHTAPPTSDVPSWYAQAHATQVMPPARPAPKSAPPSPPPPPPPPPPSRAQTKTSEPLKASPPRPSSNDPDATREMPKLQKSTPAPTPPASAKAESRKASVPKTAAAAPKSTAPKSAPATLDETQQTVIADAVRLLSWGRTWHELAELIARMADRPPLAEIRKILRAHRATIEKSAGKK